MSNQYRSPSATPTSGRQAIIIGGSMAGLLAARVLSDHFERVTLIERDRLSDKVEQRKGVPQGQQLSEIVTYKLPSNLRRHYERLKQFLEGYLVMGDAICSFNPVYGQGMTVSALEAELLQRCLQKNRGRDGLARDFFKQAARSIENPWTLAVGEDFRFPGVEGPKPPATDLINRYVSQVHRTTVYDQQSTRAFFQVMNMMTPPTTLFHPRMMWRIVKGRLAQPQPSVEAPAIVAPE